MDDITQVKPRRIIFNLCAENDALMKAGEDAGTEVVVGRTLVMLGAGTF